MVEVDFAEAEQLTSDTLYIMCHTSTGALGRPLQPALLGPVGAAHLKCACERSDKAVMRWIQRIVCNFE